MCWAANYGPFAPVVAASGSILAMGAALRLGWRGRAKWEPIEEDVPAGPQKVGGLAAAIAVALIWVRMYEIRYETDLTKIAIYCWILAFVSLLIYIMLQMLLYEKERTTATSTPGNVEIERLKIVGGLWLLPKAKRKLAEQDGPGTVQELFEGAAYNKDLLWSRPTQGLSKVLFAIAYVTLTTGGTVALGATSILIALKMKGT
jgi:hypothetical protein